jgi:hypothetical protein
LTLRAGRLTIGDMTDRPKTSPAATAATLAARKRREERLAAALRANLHRRKAQARDRTLPAPEKPGRTGA